AFEMPRQSAGCPATLTQERLDSYVEGAPILRAGRHGPPAPSAVWRDPDSNRGHHDFQSCALPAELSRRGRRCYRVASDPSRTPGRPPAATLGARFFPGFQVGQGVDRMAAGCLPAAYPHLEVQMRRGRITGLTGTAHLLARGDRLAFGDGERARLAVREHEVEADQRVLDDVVAGAAGLDGGREDRP